MNTLTTYLNLEKRENILFARLPEESAILSWAPFNGGIQKTNALFNMGLEKNTRCTDIFKNHVFEQVVAANNLPANAVGFMTAADIDQYETAFLAEGPFWVETMATVGLSNARAIGDPHDVKKSIILDRLGTINLWVACNALPGLAGQIEAIEMASAAKATALFEAGIKSSKSGQPASGTGTDTMAIIATGEENQNYCGMHTLLGELIGRAVKEVIFKGCQSAKKVLN